MVVLYEHYVKLYISMPKLLALHVSNFSHHLNRSMEVKGVKEDFTNNGLLSFLVTRCSLIKCL